LRNWRNSVGRKFEEQAHVATVALSPARALREPRRLDVRAVFGAFLLVTATGGAIAFWSATSDTREVLVAARDLPAGARLSAADLAVARVRVDDAIYGASVPAAEREALAGRELSEPVHANQLLTRAELSARSPLGPDQVAFTIPVTAETVSGRVRPGTSVQVLATANRGKPDSRTAVVLPRATVLEIGYDDRASVVHTAGTAGTGGAAADGGRLSRGKVTSITLVVSPEQALDLAQARWNADLDVAVLPPEG
jgi:Flp pilus assembly protein CpaB